MRLPHSRQPWRCTTDRFPPPGVSAEERSRCRTPRRRVDALPGVEVTESCDSGGRRCCGRCLAATSRDDSGPEAVSAVVRPALCTRQRRWRRVLCASGTGVAAMIHAATERDLPDVRALLERLHLPMAGVDEHVSTMLVAREGEDIVGTAA